jgi:CHAT domain-containing protein/tetratricopeptide (TPR) repeat protein
MISAREALVLALGVVTCTCSRPRDPPTARVPPPPIQPSGGSGARSTPTLDMDSLIAKGELVYLRGEFDGARTIWAGILERARASRDSAREGRVLTWLGLAAYRLGEYSQARLLGEQALALKLRAGLSADLSRSYNALGLLAWNEGRLTDATNLLGEASETARAAGDQAGLAKAANNLALVHIELGEFARARAGFLQTRLSARRLGDPRIEGGALTNLGMLDVQMGDPRSAIASLIEARRLYRSIDYETGEQNALGQLGTAYDALGEPRLALAALDSALEIARKEGLKQEEASNLELIAGLYRQAGDHRRALDLYQQANFLDGELGLAVEQGANLRSVAEIHSVLGRPDLAQAFAAKALRIHRGAGARLQELRDNLLLADFASTAGEVTTAASHFRAATRLAAALDARIARAEVALGKALDRVRAGDARAALRVLERARGDLSRGNYSTASEAATLRTRAYLRLSILDSAALAAQEAVAAVERVRGNFGSGFLRSSYGADKSAVYADLIDVLLRLNRTAEAFEIADRGRSRALLEHLGAGSGGRPLPGAAVRAFAQGELLLRRIDTLMSRLDALEETPRAERDSTVLEQTRALAADLVQSRNAYENHLVRAAELDATGAALLGARRVTAGEVQRALGSTEAVLEYFVTAERLLVFVVTRDTVCSVSVTIAMDDLVRRVRLARDLIGQPGSPPEAQSEVLAVLHGLLVAPVERTGALRGSRRLVIVPHSVLAYLPFAALRRSTTGRYLMQDYVLFHLPSAGALVSLRSSDTLLQYQQAATPPTLFAPFPDALPGSGLEARAFRQSVSGAQVRRGSAASEMSLRATLSQGNLVHVATHGVMNSKNSLFSRIELARGLGGPRDDGRLEVHELLGLRIKAPLVFLSGCETGVGGAWSTQFARGEDYATLAQAFLYAGARTVMATLWRIGDKGAAAFAERFYTHLALMPPADALAAAQQDLLKSSRYGSPYYWAAYQVSGDGGAVSGSHSAGVVSVQ